MCIRVINNQLSYKGTKELVNKVLDHANINSNQVND